VMTWPVELDHRHPGYQRLELKRRHPTGLDYKVVIVRTERLLELWSRDGTFFLPPVPEWKEEKRNGIRAFLDPADPGTAEMPVVSMRSQTVRRWGWWPPFFTHVEEPVLTFTNGRHRARYLAYAGAQTIPVEVTARSAPLVEAHCGVGSSQDARSLSAQPHPD
jgi:hypothetical protein